MWTFPLSACAIPQTEQEILVHPVTVGSFDMLGMCGSRGGPGGPDPPPPPPPPPPVKNHQNKRFLSNIGPDTLKNHKDAKPAFNVGPSSAHQRNAIEMAFRWLAHDGQFIVTFGSSIPLSMKKISNLDPL